MTNQMNGKSPADDPPPTAQNVAAFLSSYIGPVMSSAINGNLKSLSHFSIDAVLIMTCAVFGRCLGQVLSVGDLGPLLQLRAKCLEAFKAEMNKVKIAPMLKPPGKADTALPPDSAELVNKIKSGG